MIQKIDWKTVAKVLMVIVITLMPMAVSYAQLNRSFQCDPSSGQRCDNLSVNQLIRYVINIALGVTFGIAVLFLIIGGFRYITAGGDTEAATKGKNTVVNALIGIIIVVLSYVIVSAVANLVAPSNNSAV